MQWVGVMVSCVLCTVHALLIMGFHGQQATIDFTIYPCLLVPMRFSYCTCQWCSVIRPQWKPEDTVPYVSLIVLLTFHNGH